MSLIFFAGGECLTRHGVLVRRTSIEEEVIETHTRSGTVGWAVDSAGVLRNADANVPRVDYINGVPYLSLEEARENLVIQSQAFGTTWTQVAVAISNNTGTGVDGTTSADTLIPSAVSQQHYIYEDYTATADANYATSIYARPNGYDFVALLVHGGAGTNFAWAVFDLTDGTVPVTSTGGTGAIVSTRTELMDNGMYRCTLVSSVGSADTSIRSLIHSLASSSTGPFANWSGDASSGTEIWQAQFEDDASSASSPIPTTTGAVTRNADTFYADFPHVPVEMTVYAKFVERGTKDIGSARILQIGAANGGTDPRLLLIGGGNYKVEHDNGTANISATLATSPAIGDIVELRAVLGADGSLVIGQSINDGAETTASTATVNTLQAAWADTRLYINSGGSSAQGVNAFAAIKVARGTKTLAEMRVL